MRLKYLFAILVLLIAAIFGLLFYEMPPHHLKWTLIAEGACVVVLLYLIYFYYKVVHPYHIIKQGMEMLKEQDFTTTLRPVKQVEADVIVEIFNKMMEQLKNERLHVREQNYFLDLLIKASPLGVIIFDYDGRISSCNDAAIRILDCGDADELKGKTLEMLDSPLGESLLNIERGKDSTFRLGDGRIFRCSNLSFLDHGFQHPFMLIESLTAEVTAAEKKAYEKVIRMMAHEVNNTTAGVTSTLDTIQSALQENGENNELSDVLNVCINRCYSMSRFITNFADVVKIPEPELHLTDLNEPVNNCKLFMEELCTKRNISLHLNLSGMPIMVNIDSTLIEQVIINIVKNSAESIENKGDIYITTSSSPNTLEIADNGKGINKDTETKLFTPFFSTKPNGQGIGLVFIREILSRHHCTFSLRTYSDGFTRFRISWS